MIKDNIFYTSFSDWEMDILKAKNSLLWDGNGKRYIDFTSAWNVTNLGWNNDELLDELKDISVSETNLNSCIWAGTVFQKEYAEELVKYLPKELNTFAKATGGTEANEEAIKTARAFTGRKKIVGFKNSYHGQSIQTMLLGFDKKEISYVSSPNSDYIQIDFPDKYRTDCKSDEEIIEKFASNLESILKNEDVAGVLSESGIITGWGSVNVAPKSFTTEIRRLTKKYGTMWILDEVGTGFSRCGSLFGFELENQIPDIMTIAKGATNGILPLGTMATNRKIADTTLAKTNLTSTFGWNPIACKVATKVLKIHNRDEVWKKSQMNGNYILSLLKNELDDLTNIGDIRGIGMEIGVDFVKNKKSKEKDTKMVEKVVRECFSEGLHLVCDHESTIQIMPPLTIERKVLDEGLEILVRIIKNAATK